MEILIKKYIPNNAVTYCLKLWQQYPFRFKASSKRSTKLGDYRYVPKEKSHTITVNNDLNQYSFLVTYIHEVAHRVTFEEHGRKVKPHGTAWKHTFKHLMLPILNNDVFPEDILRPLARYLINPTATTSTCFELLTALRKYDLNRHEVITLDQLAIGQTFTFKKRTFEKLHTKRTRVLCRELVSNRNYLISKIAEVHECSHL